MKILLTGAAGFSSGHSLRSLDLRMAQVSLL
jgi:uncharacterized protein YbjT (DUF2867 family)